MRKINSKSELGSMMIEAIAMLGLIAMVTPVLYKKSAERTSELQDINTAGEIRSIIKAVDDYVGANYNKIVGKGDGNEDRTVTTGCTGKTEINGSDVEHNEITYDMGDGDYKEIPLGHLCQFLPYGVLDGENHVRASKLFSNYKIVLKQKGEVTEDDPKARPVITSFVVTDPYNELPILRASSISSMIGGNGGYVTEKPDKSLEISGNMGIWGVDKPQEELGVEVKKHAIVAASIEGISSQTATVEAGEDDSDNFLYRTPQEDKELNTMSTTLFMGSTGEGGELHDIVNIKGLAVGAEDTGNHALYIAGGDIQIGNDAAVNISDSGDITVTGNIKADGTLDIGGTATFGSNDEITLADGDGTFTGALSALTGDFGGAVTINAGEGEVKKTTINQPLEVVFEDQNGTKCISVGDNDCALKVTGGASISGNLHVGHIFNAEDLHARNTLTVGGNAANKGKYLRVAEGEFKFGNLGENETGTPTISATNTTFDVTASGNDGHATLTHGNNSLNVNASGVTMTGGSGSGSDAVSATITASAAGNVSINSDAGKTIKMNTDDFVVTNTTDGGTITSDVNSFKVRPTNTTGTSTNGYFEIKHNGTADGNYNEHMVVDKMDTYFTGTNAAKSNVYLRDSVFKLQNSDNNDVVRIGQTADSNAQIDISGEGVTMADAPNGNKVLRVNLSSSLAAHDTSYPIYIRKGAIEMTAGENEPRPYIQTEKLISTKTVPDLLDDNGGHSGAGIHYAVDPAYTSIMHDIKLTTRGGARLSDILPDFINKGIYVVDNTAPALGVDCSIDGETSHGRWLDNKSDSNPGYFNMSVADKLAVIPCVAADKKVSPWAGYVPIPTCPHGYSAVITVGLANAAMAQGGHLAPKTKWGGSGNTLEDLKEAPDSNSGAYSGSTTSPEDIAPGNPGAPYALYNQKNTWLKSSIHLYPTAAEPQGWDVLLGFVYPYEWYKSFIPQAGRNLDYFDYQGEDDVSIGSETGFNDQLIWNMFPVYTKTIESYATVYCYFNRNGSPCNSWDKDGNCTGYDTGHPYFNSSLVDKYYNQLKNFRERHSKTGGANDGDNPYTGRLNNDDADFKGYW